MGEVVVSSEGGGAMELELKAQETAVEVENGSNSDENKEEENLSAAASSLVRWERFLPRMVLRVLLVEADDSTRQIIAALLRKCSYRVAAVSDGLKAWELLKGRPHNVDLILTEVELPSISGFALLTLIAEHEICKDIPVIMMSSHDSVSTVYRCMLRGAADFLVKPVRKNELRNLWQHVWRRRTSTAGIGPPDESIAQQKIEATAENNAASNHSSGYIQCIQRNRECIEKGTDAQSSCTKPDLVAEEAYMECRQDVSLPKWSKSFSREITFQKQEESAKASNLPIVNGNGRGGSEAMTRTNTLSTGDHMNFDDLGEHVIAITKACENTNSSKVAIDLIGAFDSDTKGDCQTKTTYKLDLSPLLDLSLRRSQPSRSVNQVNDDRQRLNHSDASAFSRYVNKALRPQSSTLPTICSKQRDYETDSDKKTCNHIALDNNSDSSHALAYSSQNSLFALAAAQLVQSEISFPCPQKITYPAPIPVRGIRFENPCTNYRSVISPMSCAQTESSPIPSPGSAGHQEPLYKVKPFIPAGAELRNSMMDQNANTYNDEVERMQGSRLESLDDQGQLLSAADQSASSSFDNGAICHFNSVCYVSNGNVNPPPVGTVAPECANEGGLTANVGNAHRSVQREVALNKFRLKRKERCFEKKVRYESRKKLAEQRPRVKGQFVRQVKH